LRKKITFELLMVVLVVMMMVELVVSRHSEGRLLVLLLLDGGRLQSRSVIGLLLLLLLCLVVRWQQRPRTVRHFSDGRSQSWRLVHFPSLLAISFLESLNFSVFFAVRSLEEQKPNLICYRLLLFAFTDCKSKTKKLHQEKPFRFFLLFTFKNDYSIGQPRLGPAPCPLTRHKHLVACRLQKK
jgi:hypothetical protein